MWNWGDLDVDEWRVNNTITDTIKTGISIISKMIAYKTLYTVNCFMAQNKGSFPK